MLSLYTTSRELRSSCDKTLLKVPPKNYKTFGEHSFTYIGPVIWNKLPVHIRQSNSINVFKKALEHHLFQSVFMNQMSSMQ